MVAKIVAVAIPMMCRPGNADDVIQVRRYSRRLLQKVPCFTKLEEVDDLVFSSALSRENRKQLNVDENFLPRSDCRPKNALASPLPNTRDVLQLDGQRARKRVEYAIRVR